jgi:hypothetical protein
MFEIDVDNNKNANNEFLGNQSKFLDPEVVDNLKMLKTKNKTDKNCIGTDTMYLVLMPINFNKFLQI